MEYFAALALVALDTILKDHRRPRMLAKALSTIEGLSTGEYAVGSTLIHTQPR